MAVIPQPRTWTAGGIVDAADLNVEIRDAVNFLTGPPLTVLRQTGADAIPSGVETPIDWHVTDINRDEGWDPAQPSRYTAKTNGWHALTASVGLAASGAGIRYVSFLVSDSFHVSGSRNAPPSGGDWIGTAAATIHLDQGEWVEVTATQTSGGALNTIPGSTRFTVQWVSF